MAEVFSILVALQIALGLYSLWEGVRWLGLARRRLRSHPGFFAPRVAVLCAVKGLEPGLEQNLTSLLEFDYPNYEVFFSIVATEDPAYPTLVRVKEAGKHPAHIVVAGKTQSCGEKVGNLWAAIEQLDPEFEVLVFADSDGRPGHPWLGRLVAPLADAKLGASTTFRWLFPQRGGFWSALATAWNASIATYLGEGARNFCWGGGTAIRRSVFEQTRVLEHWRGAVSDDWAMTRALRSNARPIHFVPECLIPSFFDTDFNGLLEFTNRQMIITRVYAARLWFLGGLSHMIYCATLVTGFAAWLDAWFSYGPALRLFMLLVAVPLLAASRGYLRWLAVLELLPEWRSRLMKFGWMWTFLPLLVPFLYVENALVAAVTRRITWRGNRYELVSPAQTRVLSH